MGLGNTFGKRGESAADVYVFPCELFCAIHGHSAEMIFQRGYSIRLLARSLRDSHGKQHLCINREIYGGRRGNHIATIFAPRREK